MTEVVPSFLGPIPVEYVSDLVAPDDKESVLGFWDASRRVIMIRAGMHPQAARATVWHEWLHAMLSDAGVQLSSKAEESVCDSLGTALAVFATFTT